MTCESGLDLESDPLLWRVEVVNCLIHADSYAWVKDSRSIKIETQIPPDQVKRYYAGAAMRKIACPRSDRADCMSQRRNSKQDRDFNSAWNSESRPAQPVKTINSGSDSRIFPTYQAWLGYCLDCQVPNCQCELSRYPVRGGCAPAGGKPDP